MRPDKGLGDDLSAVSRPVNVKDCALNYATDHALAGVYVASRRKDAETMVAGGVLVLPYAKVRAGMLGTVHVNEVHCASAVCAVAYILARFW